VLLFLLLFLLPDYTPMASELEPDAFQHLAVELVDNKLGGDRRTTKHTARPRFETDRIDYRIHIGKESSALLDHVVDIRTHYVPRHRFWFP